MPRTPDPVLIKRLEKELPDKVAAALLWNLRKGTFVENPEGYIVSLHAECHITHPNRIAEMKKAGWL